LVDPGVTAQMERLLDDVLVGQQEMMGAIDAVCAQASRIIGRLTNGTVSADAALLRAAVPERVGGKAGRRAPPRKGRQLSRASGQDEDGVPLNRFDASQEDQRRKPRRKASTSKASARRYNKTAEVAVSGTASVG
jgi:hypothetical protein